ncbi:MAG TPA: hypothetical protein VIM51_02480 [Desulfosporosinus sp.]
MNEKISIEQTAEEIEQCAGCYANPSADAHAHLQGVCLQQRRQMHACGESLL